MGRPNCVYFQAIHVWTKWPPQYPVYRPVSALDPVYFGTLNEQGPERAHVKSSVVVAAPCLMNVYFLL